MRNVHEVAALVDGNVSTGEAAAFLGVDESTVRRECDALRLPYTRIRGRRTIPVKELRAYRAAHTVGAAR
jgi:excisionase family DNA binding protein